MLCEHYWPADSSPVTHGPVTICLLAEQPQDEWTTREFQLHHVCARKGSGGHSRGRGSSPLGLWPPASPGGWWLWKGWEAEGRLRVIQGRERRDVSACAALGSGPRAPSASRAVTSWGSGAPCLGTPSGQTPREAGGGEGNILGAGCLSPPAGSGGRLRAERGPPPHPQAAQQQLRRVKQLQFTTWPDHSVPEAPSSLLAFVELAREQARAAVGAGPLLVHCR